MGQIQKNEIAVYSEKYDIHGVVSDYGVVTKLCFSYNGKKIVMGIQRNSFHGETYEDLGKAIMESYVENLASHEDGRKLQLHYWYIRQHYIDGTMYKMGHGIVTGHTKLADSTEMHTSEIAAIHIDEEEEELVLTTKNSVYHCPLAYCRFQKQDLYPKMIPDYEQIREKYQDAIQYPSIKPGKVLLVLSNFSYYYFHSLYYIPEDSEDGKKLAYSGSPHVGMFQDSYLIHTPNRRVDLRYFPHYQNVQFYMAHTDGCPWFIENIGDTVLFAETEVGTIKLEPGERKEVIKENTEESKPVLPRGDLYPAGVAE